jgi:hypothetical protein
LVIGVPSSRVEKSIDVSVPSEPAAARYAERLEYVVAEAAAEDTIKVMFKTIRPNRAVVFIQKAPLKFGHWSTKDLEIEWF